MVKKCQYQYYHILLYKCNEKHDGTYINRSEACITEGPGQNSSKKI